LIDLDAESADWRRNVRKAVRTNTLGVCFVVLGTQMIRFEFPELFLLAIPLAFLFKNSGT
jgi:hypothetical protein